MRDRNFDDMVSANETRTGVRKAINVLAVIFVVLTLPVVAWMVGYALYLSTRTEPECEELERIIDGVHEREEDITPWDPTASEDVKEAQYARAFATLIEETANRADREEVKVGQLDQRRASVVQKARALVETTRAYAAALDGGRAQVDKGERLLDRMGPLVKREIEAIFEIRKTCDERPTSVCAAFRAFVAKMPPPDSQRVKGRAKERLAEVEAWFAGADALDTKAPDVGEQIGAWIAVKREQLAVAKEMGAIVEAGKDPEIGRLRKAKDEQEKQVIVAFVDVQRFCRAEREKAAKD